MATSNQGTSWESYFVTGQKTCIYKDDRVDSVDTEWGGAPFVSYFLQALPLNEYKNNLMLTAACRRGETAPEQALKAVQEAVDCVCMVCI